MMYKLNHMTSTYTQGKKPVEREFWDLKAYLTQHIIPIGTLKNFLKHKLNGGSKNNHSVYKDFPKISLKAKVSTYFKNLSSYKDTNYVRYKLCKIQP